MLSLSGVLSELDLAGSVGSTQSTIGVAADGVGITMTSGAAIVQGSVLNQYAAPVAGGTLEDPSFWTGSYLSTGTGSIALSFDRPQAALDLLWGSVDPGNELDLLSGGRQIASISGGQVIAAAGVDLADGARGFGGSEYTLVNLDGGATFDTVVLKETDSSPSFEAAQIGYSTHTVSVPEPASIGLLAAGLLGIGLVRRRRDAAGAAPRTTGDDEPRHVRPSR